MNIKQIPNIITCLRIVLVCPLLYYMLEGNYKYALYLFMIAGFSDGVDGFLARRYHWTSKFGAFMDPLADKILMMGTVIVLAIMNQIPLWVFWIILGRDVLIMFTVSFLYYWFNGLEFEPTKISKFNTVVQVLWIFILLAQLSYELLPDLMVLGTMYLAIVTTVISYLGYWVIWLSRFIRGDLQSAG